MGETRENGNYECILIFEVGAAACVKGRAFDVPAETNEIIRVSENSRAAQKAALRTLQQIS
jgi:hypothetical protein